MKKIFKCKNLFLVTFLAIAGFFSATSLVINKQPSNLEYSPAFADTYPTTGYLYGDCDSDSRTNYNPTSSSKTGSYDGQFNFEPIYIKAGAVFSFQVNGVWYNNYVSVGGGAASDFTIENGSSGDVQHKSGVAGQYYNVYAAHPRHWGSGGGVDFYIEKPSGYYTVERRYSLDGVDGGPDTVPHQLISSGGSITAPAARSGYGFDGWYTAASGGTKVTSVTKNQTVYAHFISDPVVTKYAVVDGVKQASSIGSDTVPYNTSYAIPAKIYRANSTFDGWYTNEGCTIAYTARTLTTNLTIYAKYTSHANWSGTVHVDLLNSGWADGAANYAIMFMDKTTYASEVDGWSNFVTDISVGVRLISFTYSLPFEPLKMTIVRFNTEATEPDWDLMWNQTEDIDVNEMVRIGDGKSGDKNLSYSGYPKIMAGIDPSWDQKGFLDSVKKNGSNDAEYYSTSVTLAQWEKFNIQKAPYAGGDYAGSWSTHSSLADKFQDGGSGSIQAKVAGTYAVYFDSYANSIYITTVAIAEADEWSQYFLDNVGCDPNGINVPTGWVTCATEYSKLSDDAMDIVYAATANPSGSFVEKAVARYDQALRSHPSLSHFIVDSGDTPRASASIRSFSPFSLINDEYKGNDASVVIIIVASSVSILSITALSVLMVKKRKSKEE